MRASIGVNLPFSDLPDSVWLVIAKGLGSILGPAVSLVYILPRGRREAAIRFAVGVSVGILFGPAVGAWLIDSLGLADSLTRLELVLTGSAAASLCAWWGLGVLRRIFESRAEARKSK